MHQILEGLQYIHKQNIVHLDLKPENIVCVDTTGTSIKIIDFGLANKLGECGLLGCVRLVGEFGKLDETAIRSEESPETRLLQKPG